MYDLALPPPSWELSAIVVTLVCYPGAHVYEVTYKLLYNRGLLRILGRYSERHRYRYYTVEIVRSAIPYYQNALQRCS